MGSGKSTRAYALAMELADLRSSCQLYILDPGSPLLGLPGTVCRARLDANDTISGEAEALCSLDAGRFRLPLINAARRLMDSALDSPEDASVLIDPPGVVQGVAGAELLSTLIETMGVKCVVYLSHTDEMPPFKEVLTAHPLEVITVMASKKARRLAEGKRIDNRTNLWNKHAAHCKTKTFSL